VPDAPTHGAAPAVALLPMAQSHWPGVARVYLEGIATGNATFEVVVPSWARWDATHLPDQRLVAVDGEEVVGWAALAPTSDRYVYRGVAELSLYVGEGARGGGVGRSLLEAIVARSEEAGIWTIEAGIFPENTASLTMHQHAGFRVVGRRERIGKHGHRWRDVLLVERRSPAID
jgi:L-amino acid N-acyltransferase YncA